jgi:hypothetical protein
MVWIEFNYNEIIANVNKNLFNLAKILDPGTMNITSLNQISCWKTGYKTPDVLYKINSKGREKLDKIRITIIDPDVELIFNFNYILLMDIKKNIMITDNNFEIITDKTIKEEIEANANMLNLHCNKFTTNNTCLKTAQSLLFSFTVEPKPYLFNLQIMSERKENGKSTLEVYSSTNDHDKLLFKRDTPFSRLPFKRNDLDLHGVFGEEIINDIIVKVNGIEYISNIRTILNILTVQKKRSSLILTNKPLHSTMESDIETPDLIYPYVFSDEKNEEKNFNVFMLTKKNSIDNVNNQILITISFNRLPTLI